MTAECSISTGAVEEEMSLKEGNFTLREQILILETPLFFCSFIQQLFIEHRHSARQDG